MMSSSSDVLLLCYGNPARLDDGLGAAFAARLEERVSDGITVEVGYHLAVEDALEVSRFPVVIFVDASVRNPEPFSFSPVKAVPSVSFTSHSLEPQNLLGLAESLFGARTRGYLLEIRGYAFDDFGEWLSPGARQNLESAIDFLVPLLRRRNFAEALTLPIPSREKAVN